MNFVLPSPTFINIIIWGLAAWRLTSIIHSEKIASGIRRLAGGLDTIDGEILYPDTFLGNLFSCFWCLSIWCSVIVLGVSIIPHAVVINYILAISAIAIIISITLHRE